MRTLTAILIFAGSAFLLENSAEAFTVISNAGKIARWPSSTVGYYIHDSVNAHSPLGDTPFHAAFSAWENVAGLSLTINSLGTMSTTSSSDRKNTINWIPTSWTQLGFHPPRNALAVTLLSFDSGSGVIVDSDIYFNDEDFNWGDGGTYSNLIDIQNIATHEVGHLLGLDHSSENFFEDDDVLADATMYYASGAGETYRRTLKADDESGIRSLYAASPDPTPTISALNYISKDGDDVEFQVLGTGFGDETSFVMTRSSRSVDDVVARYRQILSSTEARVTLDLGSFGNGEAEFLAFNSPGAIASLGVVVSTSSFNATSSGGGGGCSLRAEPRQDSDFSWVTFYFVLLSAVSLLIARREHQRRLTASAVNHENF